MKIDEILQPQTLIISLTKIGLGYQNNLLLNCCRVDQECGMQFHLSISLHIVNFLIILFVFVLRIEMFLFWSPTIFWLQQLPKAHYFSLNVMTITKLKFGRKTKFMFKNIARGQSQRRSTKHIRFVNKFLFFLCATESTCTKVLSSK